MNKNAKIDFILVLLTFGCYSFSLNLLYNISELLFDENCNQTSGNIE